MHQHLDKLLNHTFLFFKKINREKNIAPLYYAHINHYSGCNYTGVDMSCSVPQESEGECAAAGGRPPRLSCRPVREEAAVSGDT